MPGRSASIQPHGRRPLRPEVSVLFTRRVYPFSRHSTAASRPSSSMPVASLLKSAFMASWQASAAIPVVSHSSVKPTRSLPLTRAPSPTLREGPNPHLSSLRPLQRSNATSPLATPAWPLPAGSPSAPDSMRPPLLPPKPRRATNEAPPDRKALTPNAIKMPPPRPVTSASVAQAEVEAEAEAESSQSSRQSTGNRHRQIS